MLPIREYYSVEIGQVQNGLLYLRYGSSSEKTTVKRAKTLTEKTICYTIVKNDPRVLLPHSEAEKRKLEIFDFVILSFFFFFFITCTQKP